MLASSFLRLRFIFWTGQDTYHPSLYLLPPGQGQRGAWSRPSWQWLVMVDKTYREATLTSRKIEMQHCWPYQANVG